MPVKPPANLPTKPPARTAPAAPAAATPNRDRMQTFANRMGESVAHKQAQKAKAGKPFTAQHAANAVGARSAKLTAKGKNPWVPR